MALNSTAGSRLLPPALTVATLATPSHRLALAQLVARRRYWSLRCGKRRATEPREHYYGRLLRYRWGRENGVNDDAVDSFPAAPPSRPCKSWTKQREPYQEGSQEAQGKESDRRASPIEHEMKSFIQRYFESFDERHGDPAVWRTRVEKMLREEPYLSLFGWQEARGVWNPWGREWKAMWKEVEEEFRAMKAELRSELGGKDDSHSDRVDKAAAAKSNVRETESNSASTPPRDEWTFDPISMRRVRKRDTSTEQANGFGALTDSPVAKSNEEKEFDIPVKVPPSNMTDLGKQEIEALTSKSEPAKTRLTGFASQPWLSSDEGRGKESAPTQGFEEGASASTQKKRLVCSLDRLSEQRLLPGMKDKTTSRNAIASKETGQQNSNVASTVSQETPSSASPRYHSFAVAKARSDLDKNFEATQTRYDRELSSVQKPNNAAAAKRPGTEAAQASNTHPRTTNDADNASKLVKKALADTLRAVFEAKKALQDAKDNALRFSLDQEVNEQKSAMSTYENRAREPTNTYDEPQGTKVSWPSAEAGARIKQDNRNGEATSKAEKQERDKALVREIRNIYEDTYGAINTMHRQASADVGESMKNESAHEAPDVAPTVPKEADPSRTPLESQRDTTPTPTEPFDDLDARQPPTSSLAQIQPKQTPELPGQNAASTSVGASNEGTPPVEKPPVAPRKPDIYKILAYDKDRDDVTIARTSSSLYEESSPVRSPSSILTHLDQPQKYFGLMEEVEATGYELVAGSRRILVYRQVRPEETDHRGGIHFTVEGLTRHDGIPAARAAPASKSAALDPERRVSDDLPTTKVASADIKATLRKIRDGNAQKMHGLHEHLRRLEKQQRQMEKTSDTVAARFKSLETKLQKLSPQEGAGKPRTSRLRRVARAILRVPLLVMGAILWTSVCLVAAWIMYQIVYFAYLFWTAPSSAVAWQSGSFRW